MQGQPPPGYDWKRSADLHQQGMYSVNFSVIFTNQRKQSQFCFIIIILFYYIFYSRSTQISTHILNPPAILRLEHTLRHQEYILESKTFIWKGLHTPKYSQQMLWNKGKQKHAKNKMYSYKKFPEESAFQLIMGNPKKKRFILLFSCPLIP